MQQLLNVLTPSDTQDLVSLEDMKMKLLIQDSDTSKDGLLQELISNLSETIARMCNRVFAFEKVEETYYQLEDDPRYTQRLYLSRWPVKLTDIVSLTQDGIDITSTIAPIPGDIIPVGVGGQCVLEQKTGTLYKPSSLGTWCGVIDVVYSGGYALPDGAPASLKFAVEALIRESYMSWIRNPALFGVRHISHKESRIGYYGPNMFPVTGLPETWKVVQSVLQKYIRQWV